MYHLKPAKENLPHLIYRCSLLPLNMQHFTGCMCAVERLHYGFAPSSVNPHRLRFECSTAEQMEKRDRGVPAIITESPATAVMRMCYIHNNNKCLFLGDFCAGVTTRSRLIRRLTGCYVAVSVSDSLSSLCWIWLNCCAVVWHPTEIEALPICYERVETATEYVLTVHTLPVRTWLEWNLPACLLPL